MDFCTATCYKNGRSDFVAKTSVNSHMAKLVVVDDILLPQCISKTFECTIFIFVFFIILLFY